jgi:hypothetical protein
MARGGVPAAMAIRAGAAGGSSGPEFNRATVEKPGPFVIA